MAVAPGPPGRLTVRQMMHSPPCPHPRSLGWLELGAFAFFVQVALIYGASRTAAAGTLLPLALPAAHLLLLPFLLHNRSFWGIRLILAGLVLNLAAMSLNGGLMPVERETAAKVKGDSVSELKAGAPIPGTKNVLVESGEGQLRALSDVIVLPLPRPARRAVSAGDVAVASGAVIALFELARRNGFIRLDLDAGYRRRSAANR